MKVLRSLSFFISLVLLYPPIFAQEHRVSIPLKAWEGSESIPTSKGLIVKITTPILIGKRTEVPIKFYSPEGKLVWERKIEHGYKSGKNDEFMLVTADESALLNVEIHINGFNKDIHYITRFSMDGTVKKFEVEGREEFGEDLQAVFCDNEYLYYLATEEGKRKEGKKLILSRFNITDLSYKRFVLDVPAISNNEPNSFWSFVGQKGDRKFLVSKTHDIDKGINRHDIITFNPEGKIVNKMVIDYKIDNFVRPAYVIRQTGTDFEMTDNPDFVTFTSTTPGAPATPGFASTRSTTTHTRATPGAFSSLYFDPGSESFFITGLFGPKPFKNLGPVYEGFYILKYDQEGNNVWKLEQRGSKELLSEDKFRIHLTPDDRNIQLKVLGSQRLNFSIQFLKRTFSYEISSGGKLINTLQKESNGYSFDPILLDSSIKIQAGEYIRKNNPKNEKAVSYGHYLTAYGEVLVIRDSKAKQVEILFFKSPVQ